jgi:hypothetical protein
VNQPASCHNIFSGALDGTPAYFQQLSAYKMAHLMYCYVIYHTQANGTFQRRFIFVHSRLKAKCLCVLNLRSFCIFVNLCKRSVDYRILLTGLFFLDIFVGLTGRLKKNVKTIRRKLGLLFNLPFLTKG